MVAQVFWWGLVGVTAIRVEHLWASAVWVRFRLRRWLRAMINEMPRDRVKFGVISRNYAATGGGKYPYIFFGVRSYRLKRAYMTAQRKGMTVLWLMLGLVRFVWRFYFFPLAICAALVISIWRDQAEDVSTPIYLLCGLLAIGCLAILVEGHWALRETGDWVSWYHRDARAATAAFAREDMVDTNPAFAEAKLADRNTNADYMFGIGLLVVLPCLATTYFCLAASTSNSKGANAVLEATRTAIDAAGGNFPDAAEGLPALVIVAWMIVVAFGLFAYVAGAIGSSATLPSA